jgi:hypothetical protein
MKELKTTIENTGLVNRIDDLINQWTCPDIDKYADGSYSLYLSFTELSAKDISKEIVELMVEFIMATDSRNYSRRVYEASVNHFLKERYKEPKP